MTPSSRQEHGDGLGGTIEIVRTLGQMVEQIAALKCTGIDDVQLNFDNLASDFDHFTGTTLPRLESGGLCR